MPQFSPIPRFIFEEYIDKILSAKPVKKDEVIWTWNNVLFHSANNLGWINDNGIEWNLEYISSYKQSLNTDSYLRAPGNLIVATGGKHLNAYAWLPDEGYKDVNLEFDSNYDSQQSEIGDVYKMKYSNEPYPIPTDTVKNTISGKNYSFTIYDIFSNPSYKTIDVSKEEKEVYLRKDNAFFEWYNSKEAYEGFINDNKFFVFLGELYPSSNDASYLDIKLIRYLFKDFVIKSIPENNRTGNFLRFMEIFFDQVYHKYYEYQKQLPSIIDYEEAPAHFLEYLITMYDIPYTVYDHTDVDKLRRLARNLPSVMKKKGTFSAIISIWRILAGTDKNVENNEDITAYEWWIEYPGTWFWFDDMEKHESIYPRNESDNVSLAFFEEESDGTLIPKESLPDDSIWEQIDESTDMQPAAEVPEWKYHKVPNIKQFTDLNKCTPSYYDRFNFDYDEFTSDKILSPNYTIELDLSCRPPADNSVSHSKITEYFTIGETEERFTEEPTWSGEVFSDKFAENVYNVFESMRPITKKSHYNLLFSPISDWSGKKVPLYKQAYGDVWWNSICPISNIISGATVHTQNIATDTWVVNHNLQTSNIMVQVFDSNKNLIYPSEIYNHSIGTFFSVYITFETPMDGYAIVRKSDDTWKTTENTTVLRNIEQNIITQFYDKYQNAYIPDTQKNTPKGVRITGSDEGYMHSSVGDLVWHQDTASTVWTIDHNLDWSGTMVQVYDEDWNVIIPSSITLLDIKTCIVEFETPMKGKAVLSNVGPLNIADDIINRIKNNGAIMKFGNGEKFLSINDPTNVQNVIEESQIPFENIYQDANNNLQLESYLTSGVHNITEIGIYDSMGEEIYFYSQGSNIHKHKEFMMTVFYRINYDNL